MTFQIRARSPNKTATLQVDEPLSWDPPVTQSALTNQHDFPAIETSSVDLSFSVSTFATGWNAALTRAQKIDVVTTDFGSESPRTISFRLGSPAVKTLQLRVSRIAGVADGTGQQDPTDCEASTAPDTAAATNHTRLKPPADIVKLEDRLYYLLQPPLETILSSESLHFPFEPFPYQYQGIAFLYPAVSPPILADEMGLGKTMQAITAIRLLLRARRGAQRAADLPQAAGDQLAARVRPVGAGDSARGHRRRPGPAALAMAAADAPVKIANYELLMRDRDVVLDARSALRSGRAGRGPADQEPLQHDQPGRPRDLAVAQLGPDRHAGREQLRRIWSASSSSCRPGYLSTGHDAAADGASRAATTSCGAPRTRC